VPGVRLATPFRVARYISLHLAPPLQKPAYIRGVEYLLSSTHSRRNDMRHSHRLLAGLIIAGGLSGVALAAGPAVQPCGDGPGPMSKMGRHAMMRADPAQRVKQHLDYQKYQLKITPEQEALWNAYAEKVQAEAGKGLVKMRALAAADNLSAPERLAQREKLLEERLAAMKAVHESFNRLYAALTPEQKAIADQQAARMGMRAGRSPAGRIAPPEG